MKNKTLFIFRRDLRCYDNTGLNAALSLRNPVIPCFIFDPRQVGSKNSYKSENCIQFMIKSLQDLETELVRHNSKLYLFYGIAEKIVEKLIKKESISAVFVNRDYTPFSIKRDSAIEKICIKHSVIFSPHSDLLLNEPEKITTQTGTPYSIFTPFYKQASKKIVKKTNTIKKGILYKDLIADSIPAKQLYTKILKIKNKQIAILGGRTEGKKILRSLKKFKKYAQERNFPAIDTTRLSAHLKFGTISIRETYHTIATQLGNKHLLLKQLYWRDFFTHVAYHSPFIFGQPYHEKYKKLTWSKSKKKFDLWKTGQTGFPIVDAGMRELNTTGFMHNRVRMIVASFLIKDLHINWLWGEQYFAQKLVDYDPSVNNGNWQWSASTGCDAQPYFRIFNPWIQQKKFDYDCIYIKKWIPELKNVEPKIIHNLYKQNATIIAEYPRPIVDHKKESVIAKKIYKNV